MAIQWSSPMVNPQQSLEALAEANRIRLGRAEIKREIRDGICSIREVIECRPDVMLSITMMELFKTQPRWGKKRVMKFLGRLSIGESRQLGALTERERKMIVGELSNPHN